jgi:type II secretory pathway component GspD/PulD (secretin)
LVLLAPSLALSAPAPEPDEQSDSRLTLTFRDTPIQEVYAMLSRQERVNIMLGKGVDGSVSVNLYNVTLDEAIRAIAAAAGYVVELRDRTYVVVSVEDAGKDALGGHTQIRTFKVQYTDPEVVAELLEKHLSRFGKITTLTSRSLLVVEDLPDFLARMDTMLTEIDVRPRQILIEAKILEIALTADQVYGIDWEAAFQIGETMGTVLATGLAPRTDGLITVLDGTNFDLVFNALGTKGRIRTLSTPKLLVLENQEAEVVVGDRTGFRVTTTINQVTSESVEFVDSGVILKVRASVDREGRILLDIHPEVSSATVTDGVPSLKTTEVTTTMLAEDGQNIFIGGLIRNLDSQARKGIPVLSDVPGFGALFSRNTTLNVNTETVVLITPHLVNGVKRSVSDTNAARIADEQVDLEAKEERIDRALPREVTLESVLGLDQPLDPAPRATDAGASRSGRRSAEDGR